MKTIVIMFALAAFSVGVYAQNVPSEPQKAKTGKMQTSETYWCSKCEFSSDKPGQCPDHKTDLVKEGMYYCSMMDSKPLDKPGKCSRCGMNLKQMNAKAVMSKTKVPDKEKQ